MFLTSGQQEDIKAILYDTIREKLENYKPESKLMPFHTRLLGKDRMTLFSFIQSLNTSFGMSIFEPVAIKLAQNRFSITRKHVQLGKQISTVAQNEIEEIISDLKAEKTSPDKEKEIERLRQLSGSGKMRPTKLTQVDIYLENAEGEIFLLDIKTAKPNKGSFEEYKRTLLRWTAVVIGNDPQVTVSSYIAIPYNPYEPQPYKRWTMGNMLDSQKELLVADEMWNFLAGGEVYEELLDCFAQTGQALALEIDEFFTNLASNT